MEAARCERELIQIGAGDSGVEERLGRDVSGSLGHEDRVGVGGWVRMTGSGQLEGPAWSAFVRSASDPGAGPGPALAVPVGRRLR